MAKKSKKSTASPLDVRSVKDIPAFESLLSKGPMAMILVYADWCGYCRQFKDKVWNSSTLSKTKNINTAAVHYDMLENTSMKNTPVKGYPSVFLVGKDKEAKEIPTPQNSQDLLKFDESSSAALNNTNNNNSNNNSNNISNNKNNTNKNNNNTNNNINNNMNINNSNTLNSPSPSNNTPNVNLNALSNSYTPAPPDALEDIVNKPESNETAKQMGGSLYDVLSSYNEGFASPKQLTVQSSGARRKTAKRKSRRGLTRRRR